jgi:hypothetical protein
MKAAQHVRQIKAIEDADAGGIRERWMFGLRILRDPEQMTDSGKSLQHGAAERLIAAAGLTPKGHKRLTDQEIQRCLRCARAYPTESQIRRAATDFDSWWKLVDAGFPPYEAVDGESPADHRNDAERAKDRERDLEDRFGEQGVLFASADVQPTISPLKELKQYADEMAELTGRFVERDRKRREYVDRLIEAADGDLSVTWLDAHHRAFGEQAPA